MNLFSEGEGRGGRYGPYIEDFVIRFSQLCSAIDSIYYEIVRNLNIVINYK